MNKTTKTNKENQHYVPKFYLRRFSYCEDEKTIGVYNPIKGIFVQRAPLRSQACSSYFYGKDGDWEDRLSAVEGLTAEVLRQVANLDKQIVKRTRMHELLLFHIILSKSRTASQVSRLKKQQEDIYNMAFSGATKLPKQAPLFKRSHEENILINMAGLEVGFAMIRDLEIRVVKNYTSVPFITCDDPVLLYNQLLEKYMVPAGIAGLVHAGIQLFMPIDGETMIVAYDSKYYKLGSKKGNDLIKCNELDVDMINTLCALSYDKVLFFNEKADKAYIQKIHSASTKYERANQYASVKLYDIGTVGRERIFSPVEPENYSSIMAAGHITSARMSMKLSFIHFTREAGRFIPNSQPGNMRPTCLKIYKAMKQGRPRPSLKFTYPEEDDSDFID